MGEITAKIVADSLSPAGIRLTTMELQFHRFILPEFNTHRMFSRNASSSRAIPIEKMMKQVMENPAFPIHWGRNQPGMQAREEVENINLVTDFWGFSAADAVSNAEALHKVGLHKQVANRLLEPFQYIKVIVTATEWDNFFKLRLHPDAQPEIMELARCMKEAMDGSLPVILSHGEWHLPYVNYDGILNMSCYASKDALLADAIKCSVARCARVSYLNHDASVPDVAKDIALADMLLEAGHMSPFEHQATPMHNNNGSESPYYTWDKGITHQDRHGVHWSGNFRGFLQYRQLI